MRKIVACSLALAAVSACSSDKSKQADSTASGSVAAAGASAVGAPAPAPATPAPTATSGTIDPGTATQAELAALPGMNDSLAAAVIAGRPYANMLAVDKVVGGKLTKIQKDSLYSHVWIPIDLNKASKAEILLIPGVGPKMLHEFEEYRPYDSIDKFRREIGKYVDKAEVARLERFVTIK